jgi:hypothetical protein
MTSYTGLTKNFSTHQSPHCEEIGSACKCWTWSVKLGQVWILLFGRFSGPSLIQWQWDDHRSACEIVGTGWVGGKVLWAELNYCARIRSRLLWAMSRKKCQVGCKRVALGRGLSFQILSFFQKNSIDLNISKHKNKTIPFLWHEWPWAFLQLCFI